MKSMTRLALLVSAACLVALPARADVAPPETQPCYGKAVGTACTYNSAAGSCQNQTCYRIDYANWDRDASTSPPSASYACVECITGTSTNTNTSTTTSTTTTTGTTTKTSGADGGDSPSKDDGACSIGKQSTAKRVAPWFLAAAFSSLFLIGRRRRR